MTSLIDTLKNITGSLDVTRHHTVLFSGSSSYDKSILKERWQELSSKENMEDLDLEDDDDLYDYGDYGGRTSDSGKKDKQNSAENLTSKFYFSIIFFLLYVCLVS